MERSTSCFWFSSTNPQFCLSLFHLIVLAFEPKPAPHREFMSGELNFFSSISSPFPLLVFSHIKPLHRYISIYPHPHLPHPPASGQSHWRALTLCGCLECTTDSKAGVSIKPSAALQLVMDKNTWTTDDMNIWLTVSSSSIPLPLLS